MLFPITSWVGTTDWYKCLSSLARTTTSAFPLQWVSSSIRSCPLQSVPCIATSGEFLKAYRSGHSLTLWKPSRASYHTWKETQASPNHLACSSSHSISNHCLLALHTPAAAGVPCQTHSRLRASAPAVCFPDPALPGSSWAP